MKNILNIYKLLLILILIFTLISCDKSNKIVQDFERNDVVNKFINNSLVSRGDKYVFTFYLKDSYVEYFLISEKKSFKIENRNEKKLAYVRNKFYYDNTSYSDDEVIELFMNHLNLIRILNIKEYTTEFYFAGFDLKLTMEDGSRYYYIRNERNVTIGSWQEFLNSLEKVNENWYLE